MTNNDEARMWVDINGDGLLDVNFQILIILIFQVFFPGESYVWARTDGSSPYTNLPGAPSSNYNDEGTLHLYLLNIIRCQRN